MVAFFQFENSILTAAASKPINIESTIGGNKPRRFAAAVFCLLPNPSLFLSLDRFTRHRDHECSEIKPWFMSFPKPIFKQISEAMMLPPSYFFLRTNAGGSGDFAKYSTFDENGKISALGTFLSHVPAQSIDTN